MFQSICFFFLFLIYRYICILSLILLPNLKSLNVNSYSLEISILQEKVTNDLPMPPLFQFLSVLAFKIFTCKGVDLPTVIYAFSYIGTNEDMFLKCSGYLCLTNGWQSTWSLFSIGWLLLEVDILVLNSIIYTQNWEVRLQTEENDFICAKSTLCKEHYHIHVIQKVFLTVLTVGKKA